MTRLLGGAFGVNIVSAGWGRMQLEERRRHAQLRLEDVPAVAYHRPGAMVGGSDGVGRRVWHTRPVVTAGAKYLFGLTGTVRDQNGAAVSGATVKLFLTADDSLVHSTTTDPNGAYLTQTPYYGQSHYMVTYKTGTPDIFGTTPNTLLPQ